MKARGLDVISLAAGEPDFNTPDAVCQAAKDALDAGITKYTPSAGLPALREAIAQKLCAENRLDVQANQVVVSCGAKHSVFNAMQVLVEPGDEVLLIAPYWATYADQVRLAGGIPVIVRAEQQDGFVPSREALSEAVTSRTRAIVVNSPCNPTGAVFDRETLKTVGILALRHNLWIISDEIYEHLTYGVAFESTAALGRDIAERTITVGGFSKSFSMTGWRLGYCAAPVDIAQAMSNLQDQVTSNPTSFAQMGAIRALELPPSEVESMRQTFERRRDQFVSALQRVPGFRVEMPKGAFYAFADVSGVLGRQIATDVELAEALLDEALVATVPGTYFDAPGFLRLSYACSEAHLEEAVRRIDRFVQERFS